jgi:hypothetical protein
MSTEPATAPRTAWEKPNAVQIHVVLDEVEPPIWRRLVVPIGTTPTDLHRILQAAMGWKDRHLHRFEIGGLHYGDTALLNQERSRRDALAFDTTKVRLRRF